VAYAKANPGKINRGSPGAGIISNLAPLMFERMAGIQTTHVPFNGDGRLCRPCSAQRSTFMYVDHLLAALCAERETASARVMDSKRLPQVPNAPTFKESGYDIDAYAWYTLVAPAGTPADAIAKLNRAVNQVLVREDFISRAQAMGMEPRGGTPDDLARYIKQEYDRWVPC